MSFLPIVERELRIAARRKGTFRLRSWTALIAIIVTFAFLIAAFLGGHNAGSGLFLLKILSTYTAALCLFTSLFLTADSISEEKREGTLGLLFLTDLRGYDVVLGKFIARSLNAFYGLMALLPVMAISLLFGGLTGGEFWRMTLALLNSLFVSLVIGTWISSISRDSRSATTGTFALILLLFGVFPAMAAFKTGAAFSSPLFSVCWVSPSFPFYYAYESNYLGHSAVYWGPLIASNLLGWFLLGLASWIVTHAWQDRAILSSPSNGFSRLLRFDFTGRKSSTRRLKRLLEQDPVAWLIGDEPAVRWLTWIIVLAWSVGISMATLTANADLKWAYQGAKGCALLLKILVAAQACRFFIEVRRNGMLEILLCTPLRSVDILRGQWLALRRIFLWPLMVFVLINLLPIAMIVYRQFGSSGMSNLITDLLSLGAGFTGLAGFACYFLADIYAICWFGAWLALTSKRPALAPLWTIVFVILIPSLFCFLDIIADLFFILWAVIKLHQDFRWLLAQQFQSAPAGRIRAGKPPIILRPASPAQTPFPGNF